MTRGWFADWDAEASGWQPCLETGEGHVPCFEMWFPTEEACRSWIQETVIGAGMLP